MATQFEIDEIGDIYGSVLFRSPDAAGLAYWSEQLDSGALTLAQIVSDFVNSAEAVDLVDPIIRLYNGLFDRAPDSIGLQNWVAEADAGANFGQIVQGFVGSQEFANDYNSGVIGPIAAADAASFVTDLYHNILGRTPDTAGFDYWLSVLGTPTLTSEATVVEGFINSAEYISDDQSNIASWETISANVALTGDGYSSVTITAPPTPISIGSAPIPSPQLEWSASAVVMEFSFGQVTIPGPDTSTLLIAGPNDTGNGGSASGAVFDEYGYAIDTLNVSAGSNTNAYENLANDAVLAIGATLNPLTPTGVAVTSGNVTVTQEGADPTFTLVAIEDVQLATLNVDSGSADPLLVLFPSTGSITIDSVIDSGSTIAIVGGEQEVDLGGITDPSLTLIDASQLVGSVEFGSIATPLSQTGLQIIDSGVGLTAGSAIFTSGQGDTITINDESDGGGVIVQATGASNNIFVDFMNAALTGDLGAIVGASGMGDTLSLIGGSSTQPAWQAAPSIVSGLEVAADVVVAAGNDQSAFDLAFDTLNGVSPAVPAATDSSLGANDVVDIGDATGTNATTAIVWLGANSTVNINDDSGYAFTTADIWVTGDVTGAASSGSYALETINWNGGALNLYFFNATNEAWAGGSATNSFVDVENATSVANALDIAAGDVTTLNANYGSSDNIVVPQGGAAELAAKTGLVDWFEYGGNTYIVEAINSGTSPETHTALGTGDVVVELVGLHNLDITGGFHFA